MKNKEFVINVTFHIDAKDFEQAYRVLRKAIPDYMAYETQDDCYEIIEGGDLLISRNEIQKSVVAVLDEEDKRKEKASQRQGRCSRKDGRA